MIFVFLSFHRAAVRHKRLHACVAGQLLHTTLAAHAFQLQSAHYYALRFPPSMLAGCVQVLVPILTL